MGDHRVARIRFTTVADGDLRVRQPAATLAAARAAVLARPWTWLQQVHGTTVVTVTEPGEHAGADADAAVTDRTGVALAIHTADCAPVGLVSPQGVIGAAHAGWRGVAAGVIEAAVERMRALGAADVRAVVGPCIHPDCYEFGPAELDPVVERYGPGVRGTTSRGAPALDLPTAVTAALGRAGVADVENVGLCTACDRRFFSHRAQGDVGRQAMLVWLDPGSGP